MEVVSIVWFPYDERLMVVGLDQVVIEVELNEVELKVVVEEESRWDDDSVEGKKEKKEMADDDGEEEEVGHFHILGVEEYEAEAYANVEEVEGEKEKEVDEVVVEENHNEEERNDDTE